MKIVHVCLNGPYTDNWGYQENIIPRYHKLFGNTVTVIAQNQKHISSGKIVEVDCSEYILEDGVRVIRIAQKMMFSKKLFSAFLIFDIYDILCDLKPDFVMIHGLIGSVSALDVRKYIEKTNRKCIVVADIHQDFYNSYIRKNIKGKLMKIVLRFLNNKMFPYYQKIYYVAPSCKKYAEEYYKAPIDKLTLLPLACDTSLIKYENIETVRCEIRASYNFNKEDIIVCHGGKLDHKKKTIELIKAVRELHEINSNIKMILFGEFSEEIQVDLYSELQSASDFLVYTGMLTNEEYYKIFIASNIAAFPGGQSVLWQQAIACGLATIVKRHEGIEYLDLGGNIIYFDNDTKEEVYDKLLSIIVNDRYIDMQEVALNKGSQYFSYERISKEVLQCAQGDSNNGLY